MDFSIVIPTRDRSVQLRACLDAVQHLAFPRDRFEVIVVDDGGREPLDALVSPFLQSMSLRVCEHPGRGPASARNAGAAVARGAYLAFTDDDCAPAADWLLRLREAMARNPGKLVGGRTVNALADVPCSTASQLLLDYLYAYYNRAPDDATFLASCNVAVPAERFRELGGFDASYPRAAAEDRDLCARWRQRGFGMVYAEHAVVYHRHRLSLADFCRQHANYGQGAFRFHRTHTTGKGGRVRVEPTAFYAGLLATPFVRRTPMRGRLTALLVLSQVANLVGFARAAWDDRRRGTAAPPSSGR